MEYVQQILRMAVIENSYDLTKAVERNDKEKQSLYKSRIHELQDAMNCLTKQNK